MNKRESGYVVVNVSTYVNAVHLKRKCSKINCHLTTTRTNRLWSGTGDCSVTDVDLSFRWLLVEVLVI